MKLAVRDRVDDHDADGVGTADEAAEITDSAGTFGTTERAEGETSVNPERP
jgi:hypothetical protein